MRPGRNTVAAVALLCAWAACAVAQTAEPSPATAAAADKAALGYLIGCLNGSDDKLRHDAEQDLAKLGAPALEPLAAVVRAGAPLELAALFNAPGP